MKVSVEPAVLAYEAQTFDPAPIDFDKLSLDTKLLSGIHDLGWKDTRPVQSGVIPLALGELAHSKRGSLGETLGKIGLQRLGRKKWEAQVHRSVSSLRQAFRTDYVVLGGGNAKRLKRLPSGARRGDNDNAFIGGARLWGLAGAHAKPGKKHIWIIT